MGAPWVRIRGESRFSPDSEVRSFSSLFSDDRPRLRTPIELSSPQGTQGAPVVPDLVAASSQNLSDDIFAAPTAGESPSDVAGGPPVPADVESPAPDMDERGTPGIMWIDGVSIDCLAENTCPRAVPGHMIPAITSAVSRTCHVFLTARDTMTRDRACRCLLALPKICLGSWCGKDSRRRKAILAAYPAFSRADGNLLADDLASFNRPDSREADSMGTKIRLARSKLARGELRKAATALKSDGLAEWGPSTLQRLSSLYPPSRDPDSTPQPPAPCLFPRGPPHPRVSDGPLYGVSRPL